MVKNGNKHQEKCLTGHRPKSTMDLGGTMKTWSVSVPGIVKAGEGVVVP